MRRCFEFSPFSHRCHRDVQKMAVAERMRFFPLMAAVLLGLLLGTTNQQLSSLLGYQGSSGVREALLAVNAFCDSTCSPAMNQGLLNQCFQSAINQNEVIVQILRLCTINTRYIVYCTQNTLVQMENCVLQYASSYFSVANSFTKSCFRDALSVGTIDCLRMRYPRLNRLLPLGPPGYGTSSLSPSLLGIG